MNQDLNQSLSEEKRKKSSPAATGWRASLQRDNSTEMDQVKDELNSTRIKLIEKEREVVSAHLREKLCQKAALNSSLYFRSP